MLVWISLLLCYNSAHRFCDFQECLTSTLLQNQDVSAAKSSLVKRSHPIVFMFIGLVAAEKGVKHLLNIFCYVVLLWIKSRIGQMGTLSAAVLWHTYAVSKVKGLGFV